MKNLFVDVKAIVNVNVYDNAETLPFAKNVICNLYRLKKLGHNLIFTITDKLLDMPAMQNVINILNREFTFNINNNTPEIINADDYLIDLNDLQLLIKNA